MVTGAYSHNSRQTGRGNPAPSDRGGKVLFEAWGVVPLTRRKLYEHPTPGAGASSPGGVQSAKVL